MPGGCPNMEPVEVKPREASRKPIGWSSDHTLSVVVGRASLCLAKLTEIAICLRIVCYPPERKYHLRRPLKPWQVPIIVEVEAVKRAPTHRMVMFGVVDRASRARITA